VIVEVVVEESLGEASTVYDFGGLDEQGVGVVVGRSRGRRQGQE
jgi:DUF2075 family protein